MFAYKLYLVVEPHLPRRQGREGLVLCVAFGLAAPFLYVGCVSLPLSPTWTSLDIPLPALGLVMCAGGRTSPPRAFYLFQVWMPAQFCVCVSAFSPTSPPTHLPPFCLDLVLTLNPKATPAMTICGTNLGMCSDLFISSNHCSSKNAYVWLQLFTPSSSKCLLLFCFLLTWRLYGIQIDFFWFILFVVLVDSSNFLSSPNISILELCLGPYTTMHRRLHSFHGDNMDGDFLENLRAWQTSGWEGSF